MRGPEERRAAHRPRRLFALAHVLRTWKRRRRRSHLNALRRAKAVTSSAFSARGCLSDEVRVEAAFRNQKVTAFATLP